jgi:hypothetical protein
MQFTQYLDFASYLLVGGLCWWVGHSGVSGVIKTLSADVQYIKGKIDAATPKTA